MSEGTIQGASAGVMLPDGSMWTGASGYADGAHQRPLQATDQFRVGSQTKTYTANLILQMADQGLVRLDQTLEQLVPTLNVPNAGRITVRDLLTMRSGIPEYLSAPSANQPGKLIREEWNDADGDVAYTAEQLVRQTNLVERRDEPPGTRMEYTNTNYALLGIIAEQASCRQATGCKTIGQLINQQVLARVPGIAGALYPTTNNPFTRPAVEGNSPTASGRVVNTTYSNPTVPGAAGALISTPRDELLWIREVVTNSNRLVSNATHQALIDSVTKAVRDGIIGGIVPVTYGYGLMSARSPGTGDEMIGHGGSLTGYTSQLFWLPELNMGFAVNVAGQPASFPKNLPYQYMGIAGLPSDDKAYSALPLYWMLQRNVVLASQAQGDCGNGAIGRVGSGQSATCSGDSVRTRPIVLEGSKLTVNDAGRHVTGATYGDDGVQGATSLLRPAVAFYGSNLEGIHLKGGATLNVQPMALVEATGVNSTAIRLTGGNNKLVVNGQVGAYGQGSKAILGDNGADDVTLGPDSKVFGDIDLGGGANRLVANGTVKGAIRYSGPDTRIAGTGALYTDVGGTTVSPG
ncbi:MAG TPA: serine hydrolase domain-containing protein, partial [Azospirillaceae bacterium]|nr:serine hydrolase domain-containing protein [Azospirillaceae bacterium]